MLKKRSKEIKGFVIGIIFTIVLSGTVVAANPAVREIFFGVTVSLNGEILDFAEDSQPFIMNGRTFLPIRVIAELVGLDVNFINGAVHLTDNFIRGTWQGNVYTNDFLGLTFTLPDNWNIAANVEILDGVDSNLFAIMSVTSPYGASVRAMYENIPIGMTAIEYINEMASHSAAMGMDVNFNFNATTIGNYEWQSFQTIMVMDILEADLNVYGHYFINVQNGIARIISILSSDVSESLEDIMAFIPS